MRCDELIVIDEWLCQGELDARAGVDVEFSGFALEASIDLWQLVVEHEGHRGSGAVGIEPRWIDERQGLLGIIDHRDKSAEHVKPDHALFLEALSLKAGERHH